MSSEFLSKTIRNVLAIDRAMSSANALRIGQIVYLSDSAASRILRLTGFSYPESNGRWTVSKLASINLKLAPESVETGRLRLHVIPFVTEEKGQTLRLRCGESPEKIVEFSPGTPAWRIVDLPLTGVEADTLVRIQIAVAHTFVPSKLGIGTEPRALGLMVQKIEILGATEDLIPLTAGASICLSSPDSERMVRLAGFSTPDPDGRWTDGMVATIELKLAHGSVETGRLRLHMMPFVTEEKGQTLRLRCGKSPEKIVEFSPGTPAWRIVDFPLTGVEADGHAQIRLEVGQTFVPLKLGISTDPRSLGVMVQKIELLSDTDTDQIDKQLGEQPKELPTQSTLEAEDLIPLAVGSSISLASPDAGRMIRLTGFSGLEPDGRWTDGNAAMITLRLADPPDNGYLRLYFTPSVTAHTGQSIRVKYGDEKELTRTYSPGHRRESMLDLPLDRAATDGEISISITIDAPNSSASLGLGADERRLGIQLHRLEFVAGLSRVTGTAPLRSLIGPVRRLLSKPRSFLTRPLVEKLGQIENQIRNHADALHAIISDLSVRDHSVAEQLNVQRVERARLINEEFAKQSTQLNAVRGELARLTHEEFAKQAKVEAIVRTIESLATRAEIEAAGTRLFSIEQIVSKLTQLVTGLHEKTDAVSNRASRVLLPVDDDTVLVRSLVGYVYCSRNDDVVLSVLADRGELEPGLRQLLERVLEPGMVFLDLGAHVGLHSLTAARRVGKNGHVFSYEPTPTTYKLLSRTVRLNAYDDRITIRRAAAGSENTGSPLYIGTISGHNSLYPLPDMRATVEVEVVRLDSELPPGQHVDVVKIDVEGAELNVLRGMSRIITENPDILIIAEYGPSHLARTGVTPKDWLSAFRRHGSEAYVIEEPSGNCVPIDQVNLEDVFSVNIAFIQSTSPLQPRLFGSAPGQAPMVVIGAGGHAKVVIELIRAEGRYSVIGCTDRDPERRDIVGVPILGSDDVLSDLYAQGVRYCFVALGDNALRRKVAAEVTGLGFQLVNAISPKAVISPTVRLGRGVAVMAGAVINADTTIGDLAIVNTRASVDHDCQIGEAAHVAPQATLAGSVCIGPLAFIGAGATVIPGVSIGEATVVGAGATVISNLGSNLVAVGVPARSLQKPSGDKEVIHDEQH